MTTDILPQTKLFRTALSTLLENTQAILRQTVHVFNSHTEIQPRLMDDGLVVFANPFQRTVALPRSGSR